MNKLDILALSAISVALAYPLLRKFAGQLWSAKPGAESKEAWRQRWTHKLIELLGDLDRDGAKAGAALCRELMWEILGGDQAAGGKK